MIIRTSLPGGGGLFNDLMKGACSKGGLFKINAKEGADSRGRGAKSVFDNTRIVSPIFVIRNYRYFFIRNLYQHLVLKVS